MKKQVLKLDLDDFGDDNEDLAYLFFHTACPGYVFVDDLNHLYDLALSRENDLDLNEQKRPTVGSGVASHWAPGHKMMILKGENAAETAEVISNDFGTPPPQPDTCNPAEMERYDILTSYQQAFTPVNIYDIHAPVSTSKKTLKERTELENLFNTILDLLDLSGIE